MGLWDRLRAWWRDRQEARLAALNHEAAVKVGFDDDGLWVQYPKSPRHAIGWDEIDSVAIETNDSGPWGPDVFWRFEGGSQTVAYPQGATGESEILDLLSDRFPGFDYEQMIQAMACTENQRFVCWRRNVAEGSVARAED